MHVQNRALRFFIVSCVYTNTSFSEERLYQWDKITKGSSFVLRLKSGYISCPWTTLEWNCKEENTVIELLFVSEKQYSRLAHPFSYCHDLLLGIMLDSEYLAEFCLMFDGSRAGTKLCIWITMLPYFWLGSAKSSCEWRCIICSWLWK